MALPHSFALLDSEFGAFLYASIGEDQKGMPLSVVSALTRLDIDPWQEAARLSALRNEEAVSALALTIDRLPEVRREFWDARRIAAGLVALLPRGGFVAPPAQASPPRGRRVYLTFGVPTGLALLAGSAIVVGTIAHVIWRLWS
ncbi:MAG TPA: hypothetical protein VMU85_05510 [Stellaceae bacterium]|nr:hypothetical protein [Stellaceae bacterium]